MEKLCFSLMMKLFHLSNMNLQDLLIFHAMTRIGFSFSQEDGGISKRKLLGTLMETRKELEEEERGELVRHVQLLHKESLGVNP